ncbi:MAG TPA: cupin domain-containing protein [Streptosporangiaceae bacterium]
MRETADGTGVRVLPLRGTGPRLPVVEGGGFAQAVIWPGMGAAMRSVHLIQLAPSSGTVRQEHPAESVYYVREGSGTVAGDGPPADGVPLAQGSMVHVAPGTGYRFAAGPGGLEIFGGPCPCDPAVYRTPDGTPGGADAGRTGPPGRPAGPPIQVLHQDKPALMLPIISADARMIVWPGIGAWTATMNYVRMRPGEENSPHTHEESEDTIVILEGRGSIDDLTSGETHEFQAGDVIYVPARLRHAVRANRGENVVSVGGPCPADLPFLRLCGADIGEPPERAPGS